MVGNRLGVCGLVMDSACWKVAFVLAHQCHAQLITDPHNFVDGPFHFQAPLDERSAKKIKAWMGKLGNQFRVLHYDSYAWRWPKVKFMAVPKSESKW
ncbi:hypothetical protein D3C80_2028810 [compost metagenome]